VSSTQVAAHGLDTISQTYISYLLAKGQVITSVSEGTAKDVDAAVKAAQKAYKTSWGLKVPGSTRGQLLTKLADLLAQNVDELAALDSLNNGALI
jgi:aldehyde dehydrogenase (NAD+)